jgi:RNA polymerase sigma-70 factor, ECF subfamily
MAKEEGSRFGEDLLGPLRKGDERAWAEVFRRYGDKVFGFSIRMVRSREEAEEVCQEVWERAVRAIGGFRGESSLDTWLCTIARNRCLSRIEALKRKGDMGDDSWILEIPDDAPGPDQRLVSHNLRNAMEQAIGGLEPEFREAILLREVNGLSYEEIAQVTQTPLATVKTRIYRARVKLQSLLVEFRP